MDFHYLTYFLNGFLMIAMPVALGIALTRRFGLNWRLWFIGAAVFILSQIGHIPFNWAASQILNRTALVYYPITAQLVFNAIFLGLSAGLWEELSRYAMFRWWAKDARSWRTAILTGAGHGGAEAIILGILVLIGYISMVAYRNADFSAIANLSSGQIALARQQVQAYWSAPWYSTLLGALERILAIPVQVSFAVIVLQTFIRRQWFWVWLAVLFHALLDATAVFGVHYLGVYWTEAIVSGFTLLSVIIIYLLRQPGSPADLGTVPQKPVPVFSPRPVEETPEKLEDTRYQ